MTEIHHYLILFVKYAWEGQKWPVCYKLSDDENSSRLLYAYFYHPAGSMQHEKLVTEHVVHIAKRVGDVQLVAVRTGERSQ